MLILLLYQKENLIDCLDEIKIPAQNVMHAQLNDQWVEEIGLDTKKFGYASSFRDLLSKKRERK